MHFDLLFFPLAALKSLAVRTDACVFRLASEKNTCVNFAQILPWRTITLNIPLQNLCAAAPPLWQARKVARPKTRS
jgi:hypothetical protein